MSKKLYLGDGVYIKRTPYDFILTAEDDEIAYNEIFLDPDVMRKLIKFVEDEPWNDQ